MNFHDVIELLLLGNIPLTAIVFLPMIRVILKAKNAEGVSLSTLFMSVWMQGLGSLDLFFRESWIHFSAMTLSFLGCCTTIAVTIYFKYFYLQRQDKNTSSEDLQSSLRLTL